MKNILVLGAVVAIIDIAGLLIAKVMKFITMAELSEYLVQSLLVIVIVVLVGVFIRFLTFRSKGE